MGNCSLYLESSFSWLSLVAFTSELLLILYVADNHLLTTFVSFGQIGGLEIPSLVAEQIKLELEISPKVCCPFAAISPLY